MRVFKSDGDHPYPAFLTHSWLCLLLFVTAGTSSLVQAQGEMGNGSLTSPGISIQPRSTLTGSVPSGKVSPEVLKLTIKDAIQLGLRNNLGLILSNQGNDYARAARIRALSELLPHLSADLFTSVQQVSIAQFGFPPSFTGGSQVIGPFGYFGAQATLNQTVFDFTALNRAKASAESQKAARWTYQNTRDLVVLVSGASYLHAAASLSRVDAAQAELNTARTAYERAANMRANGVVAAIEELRAQVEMQAQEQRLLAARNQFERAKLDLARAIGVPVGQQFELAEKMPYDPLPPLTLEVELQRAYENRSDYKSLQAQVRSAELQRKAAVGERFPSLNVQTQIGDIGRNLGSSHGVFAVAGAITIPIFRGNVVKGDILQADTLLKQRQAELDDLRGRIEYEIRTAFLDVQTASQQVEVATAASKVANEQLVQAQDRFAAGVAGNLEVVQAQQAVAVANENYISSLYAHNFAKLSLARAVGVAEAAVMSYLGGK